MNILERFGLTLHKFSVEERHAQEIAYAVTSKAKALLDSKAAVTVEALLGVTEIAPFVESVKPIVTKLCNLLSNTIISDDLEEASLIIGNYGALLTRHLHGNKHPHLRDYVYIFEVILKIKKG